MEDELTEGRRGFGAISFVPIGIWVKTRGSSTFKIPHSSVFVSISDNNDSSMRWSDDKLFVSCGWMLLTSINRNIEGRIGCWVEMLEGVWDEKINWIKVMKMQDTLWMNCWKIRSCSWNSMTDCWLLNFFFSSSDLQSDHFAPKNDPNLLMKRVEELEDIFGVSCRSHLNPNSSSCLSDWSLWYRCWRKSKLKESLYSLITCKHYTQLIIDEENIQ